MRLTQPELMMLANQVATILAAKDTIGTAGGVVAPEKTLTYTGDLTLDGDLYVDGDFFILDDLTGASIGSGAEGISTAVPEMPF